MERKKFIKDLEKRTRQFAVRIIKISVKLPNTPEGRVVRNQLEPISKIVDHAQGQGENRFNSEAYTLVFEHFESVFNTALGR